MEPSKSSVELQNKNPGQKLGFLFFAMALVGLLLSHSWWADFESRPRAPFLSPPQIRHLTFGFKEQVADSLWVRALQDFDYCEQKKDSGVCRSQGWLFRMLDLITDLSPHFRMPYAAGGLALTVLVSDIEGASKIFDKGVRLFPEDWPLLYRAAYHALYEEKNKLKAAELLRSAARWGGPPWLNSLATRLYVDEGEKDLALGLLRELEASPQRDERLIQRMKRRLGL